MDEVDEGTRSGVFCRLLHKSGIIPFVKRASAGELQYVLYLRSLKKPAIWALKALAAHCDIAYPYPHYLREVRSMQASLCSRLWIY